MTQKKESHKTRPHYQFNYNPYNHRGFVEVVEGLGGKGYIAQTKKELLTLKTALKSFAPALAQAVGDTIDPDCDGVGLMLLDLVSTDEECEEANREARAEERAQAEEIRRMEQAQDREQRKGARHAAGKVPV
jgi:hypothetical protein